MNYLFKVTGYRTVKDAVELRLIVQKDILPLLKLNTTGEIKLDDCRRITAKQRQRISRNIKDIADHLGYGWFEGMEALLQEFSLLAGETFAHFEGMTQTEAGAFIDYLLEFIFRFDVSLNESIFMRIGNINQYLWLCLKYRRCAICGLTADLHHWDSIGAGRDRTSYDDSNHRKIALCRIHHTEAHNIGRDTFGDKYKVDGIIYND